jgi:GT2 family glycosyltransferase
MNQELVHICVNYKNDHQTHSFLKSLIENTDNGSVNWVLVNNSAQSQTDSAFADLVELSNKRVVVINCPENLGYFGGAQRALREIKGYPITIVSNTDLLIEDELFYQRILKFQKENWGCLAPAILSSVSKKDMNPFMIHPPSRKKIKFWKGAFSSFLGSVVYQLLAELKYRLRGILQGPHRQILEAREIYAPHGALMIFSSEYLKRGGSFSHPCFLFGEEITGAENCKKMGLKVYYEPEIKVWHFQHGAIGTWGNIFSYKTFLHRRDSMQKCYEFYFGV